MGRFFFVLRRLRKLSFSSSDIIFAFAYLMCFRRIDHCQLSAVQTRACSVGLNDRGILVDVNSIF